MMGISLDELNVVEQFKGQETASTPALVVAGIEVPKSGQAIQIAYTQEDHMQIHILVCKVRAMLTEQSRGWIQRSIF